MEVRWRAASHELALGARVLAGRAGDLVRLRLGQTPGAERLVRRRQLIERVDGLQRLEGGGNRLTRRRREPVPHRAGTTRLVGVGVVDPLGREDRTGGAEVLDPGEQLDRAHRAGTVEQPRLEVANDHLEGVERSAQLVEHRPGCPRDRPAGSARLVMRGRTFSSSAKLPVP